MTSREIIQGHLNFSGPPRIGFAFGGGRRNDFIWVHSESAGFWEPRRWTEGPVEFYDDEWGNVWFRMAHMGQGGEIYKPAIGDWAMLKDYRLPDLANPRRFEKARAVCAAEKDRYRLGGLPGFPFAICRYLRKMEIYFQDLLLERESVDELHERVTGLLEQVMEQYARVGADGVFFCEDWGVQDRLLIRPAMWREIFKPLFVRLCATARRFGLSVFMHSCGYNWEILDDLAEAGINVLQFDQTHLYGVERLAEKLQRLHVCLESPVDIQRVLPTGDRGLITEYARRLCRLFGGQKGGFIACSYGDLKGIGVQPEWAQWAYEAFVEAGDPKPTAYG
jgi:hypothetical protein